MAFQGMRRVGTVGDGAVGNDGVADILAHRLPVLVIDFKTWAECGLRFIVVECPKRRWPRNIHGMYLRASGTEK